MSIWLTVQELSSHLKVSEIVIYKWLKEGILPASKIGRIWRFEEAVIDDWVRKQKTSSPLKFHENFPFASAIEDFIRTLKKNYGSHLKQVILYGSWARGDQTEGSDVDLLVVLDSVKNYWSNYKKITEAAYQATFGKNRSFVFSCNLMSEQEYLTGQSPLLLNIRKEGKKAA